MIRNNHVFYIKYINTTFFRPFLDFDNILLKASSSDYQSLYPSDHIHTSCIFSFPLLKYNSYATTSVTDNTVKCIVLYFIVSFPRTTKYKEMLSYLGTLSLTLA